MNGLSLWKSTAYVAALFVVGAITGAVIAVSVTKQMLVHPPREHDMSEQMLKTLRERLQLTPAQLGKIDPIIQKASTDLRSLYDDTRKRAGTVMDAVYTQVGAELTADQKVKLQQLKNERHFFPPGRQSPGGPPGGSPGDPHHHHHPRPEQSSPGDPRAPALSRPPGDSGPGSESVKPPQAPQGPGQAAP